MPVLDSSYISTWWFLIDPISGNPLLVDDFSEKQGVEISKQALLNGDIGVHVQNVGGMYYESDLSGPLLVFLDSNVSISTILNSIISGFAYIQQPLNGVFGTPVSLLKSATISFSEAGTTAMCSFISDAPGLFGYTNYQTQPTITPEFVARNARFYDTSFNLNIGLAGSNFYQIISGNIAISVDINNNYFVGSNQLPWFSVQGYTVDGDVTVMAKPGTVGSIPMQQNGVLVPAGNSSNANGTTNLTLSVAGVDLSLGNIALSNSATYTLKTDSITTYRTSFKTYTNITTPLTTV